MIVTFCPPGTAARRAAFYYKHNVCKFNSHSENDLKGRRAALSYATQQAIS